MSGPILTASVSLFIFLMVQAAALIWALSKLTTTLEFVRKSVQDLETTMGKYGDTFYRKEDAAQQVHVRDKQSDELWKTINGLRDRLHEVEGKASRASIVLKEHFKEV